MIIMQVGITIRDTTAELMDTIQQTTMLAEDTTAAITAAKLYHYGVRILCHQHQT